MLVEFPLFHEFAFCAAFKKKFTARRARVEYNTLNTKLEFVSSWSETFRVAMTVEVKKNLQMEIQLKA